MSQFPSNVTTALTQLDSNAGPSNEHIFYDSLGDSQDSDASKSAQALVQAVDDGVVPATTKASSNVRIGVDQALLFKNPA